MDTAKIFIVQTALAVLPRQYIHRIVGQHSLEEIGNKELAKLTSKGHPRPSNFNKILEVEGVKSGNARWFTEVENRTETDPVVIFFHGGAYSLGMVPGQAAFITALHRVVPASKRLSIVWLDYTLSTVSSFPQQLIEAANTYSAVQKTSKNIILMGDSAGANLAINLMRHIHEPFSKVTPVLNPVKPTASVLISPWVELLMEDPPSRESSFEKYKWRDYITWRSVVANGEIVLNEKVWPGCQALFGFTYKDTSVDWDAVLPSRTLVTEGEVEILRDSIEKFYEISGLKRRNAMLYIEPNGVHDSPAFLGPRNSKSATEIFKFISKL